MSRDRKFEPATMAAPILIATVLIVWIAWTAAHRTNDDCGRVAEVLQSKGSEHKVMLWDGRTVVVVTGFHLAEGDSVLRDTWSASWKFDRAGECHGSQRE